MKKATMSSLFFLVFLGLSFGSEFEPKEDKMKNNLLIKSLEKI